MKREETSTKIYFKSLHLAMCCKLLGVEFDVCWKHCNSHNGNHLSCSNFFVHFLFTAIHRGSFLVQNHGSNHLVFSKTCWTGFFLRWGEEVGPLKIPPHAPHPPTECHPYAAWSTCCWSLTQQMEGISLHPVRRVICVVWKKVLIGNLCPPHRKDRAA